MTDSLAKLDGAVRALAEAKTLPEIKEVHDTGKAFFEYARAADLGLEAQNHAAIITALARRKGGEVLRSIKPNQGSRNDLTSGQAVPKSPTKQQTIEEAGMNKKAAQRWEKEAKIPEESLNNYFQEKIDRREQITFSGIRRLGMAIHYSSETDDWETPQELFDILDNEFDFTLDVCALDSSAKCDRFYTPNEDGLAHDWHDEICWMNPPYGDEIKTWVRKAHDTGMSGGVVVCLIPARVDTNWWWDYCIKGEIRFLKGRLKFSKYPTGAPFPSAVVIFRGKSAGVDWWEWK